MSRKMARKQMQPAQQLGGGNFIMFSLTMAQMKKKKKTARRLKVSLAQNPWLPGTKLRKKDYVLSFQAAGCVVPRLPSALLSCTHRSFSQPSCSSADRGHLLTCGLGSGVCGHVGTRVCRWRSVCGTCERDNFGVLLCLRCHHLVL